MNNNYYTSQLENQHDRNNNQKIIVQSIERGKQSTTTTNLKILVEDIQPSSQNEKSENQCDKNNYERMKVNKSIERDERSTTSTNLKPLVEDIQPLSQNEKSQNQCDKNNYERMKVNKSIEKGEQTIIVPKISNESSNVMKNIYQGESTYNRTNTISHTNGIVQNSGYTHNMSICDNIDNNLLSYVQKRYIDSQFRCCEKIAIEIIKEENRTKREYPDFKITIDSNKNLCIEYCNIKNPNIKTILKICDAVNLRITIIQSYYYGKKYSVYEISWQGQTEKIYLKKLTSDLLAKKLSQNGYAILVTSKTEKIVHSSVYQYLYQNSIIKFLPYTIGWTQNEKGAWKLTKPNELTMKEILKNV